MPSDLVTDRGAAVQGITGPVPVMSKVSGAALHPVGMAGTSPAMTREGPWTAMDHSTNQG